MTRVVPVLLAGYAFVLLSIGLDRDWCLVHEDNGAFHTTLALSHLELGLTQTRAHNLFFGPRNGERSRYGNHPPGVALALALAFRVSGATTPAVARLVPITFHLGSLFLVLFIGARVGAPESAWLAGFFFATVPMSAFFGRMVNYEPLCLFAVLIQLGAYVAFLRRPSGGALAWLAFGIVLGGLIDWAALFFAAALFFVEAARGARGSRESIRLAYVALGALTAVLLLDILHLAYVGDGALSSLGGVLVRPAQAAADDTPTRFLLNQLENFRRYFTHAGLLSSLAAACALVLTRSRLARAFFDFEEGPRLRRLLIASGAAALGYVLSAPSWAKAHHYWQFYFLVFVAFSMSRAAGVLMATARSRASIGARVLVGLFYLEVVATAALVLHYRHTTLGGYAIEQTAHLRAKFLAP